MLRRQPAYISKVVERSGRIAEPLLPHRSERLMRARRRAFERVAQPVRAGEEERLAVEERGELRKVHVAPERGVAWRPVKGGVIGCVWHWAEATTRPIGHQWALARPRRSIRFESRQPCGVARTGFVSTRVVDTRRFQAIPEGLGSGAGLLPKRAGGRLSRVVQAGLNASESVVITDEAAATKWKGLLSCVVESLACGVVGLRQNPPV